MVRIKFGGQMKQAGGVIFSSFKCGNWPGKKESNGNGAHPTPHYQEKNMREKKKKK